MPEENASSVWCTKIDSSRMNQCTMILLIISPIIMDMPMDSMESLLIESGILMVVVLN